MIEKLLKIQKELKVPKKRFNKFGNYFYRNTDDIVEAAKPLCSSEGLVLTLSDEVVEVGGRVYVKATARLSDGEKNVEVSGYAREAEKFAGMADAQITGSSSSYARKYALNGLFAIDDEQDADAVSTHGKVDTVSAKTQTEAGDDLDTL